MPRLRWDQVRESFAPDGSLLDAYVLDTTASDWQTLVDLVRSKGWWFSYSEDGRSRPLPPRAADVFAQRRQRSTLLEVRLALDVGANIHFFARDQIEMDFAREELQGQERLDVLCAFLNAIGRRLAKPVVVTPEACPGHPLIGYDLATDRVIVLG